MLIYKIVYILEMIEFMFIQYEIFLFNVYYLLYKYVNVEYISF
jgi:hypothetical protein